MRARPPAAAPTVGGGGGASRPTKRFAGNGSPRRLIGARRVGVAPAAAHSDPPLFAPGALDSHGHGPAGERAASAEPARTAAGAVTNYAVRTGRAAAAAATFCRRRPR